MSVVTLMKFLVGSRGAIERLAACPPRRLLPLGFAFVLSGGLARNYDGAYLPTEWTVMTHGLVASSVNAFLVFAALFLAIRAPRGTEESGAQSRVRPPFLAGYIRFLGLFWLTAPLAWVYGVPWERWFEPLGAIEANAWTLAVVAAWRVLLISRVLSVLYGARYVPALLVVLLVSDAVLFAAAVLSPAPPVDFMGGLRYSEEEQLMSALNFAVLIWSILLAGPLLLAALIALRWLRGRWGVSERGEIRLMSLWLVAAAALGGWCLAARGVQEEQRNRYLVERAFAAGESERAIGMMSDRGREGFPPVWDPPPKSGTPDRAGVFRTVREMLEARRCAPWVERLYFRKSWNELLGSDGPMADAVWAIERTYDRSDSARREEIAAVLRLHVERDAALDSASREGGRELLKKWAASQP